MRRLPRKAHRVPTADAGRVLQETCPGPRSTASVELTGSDGNAAVGIHEQKDVLPWDVTPSPPRPGPEAIRRREGEFRPDAENRMCSELNLSYFEGSCPVEGEVLACPTALRVHDRATPRAPGRPARSRPPAHHPGRLGFPHPGAKGSVTAEGPLALSPCPRVNEASDRRFCCACLEKVGVSLI